MSDGQTTAVATAADEPLYDYLKAAAKRAIIRGGLTEEDLAKAAALSVQRNPMLAGGNVDRRSLGLALVQAGQMGLEPDGRKGALVPYFDKEKQKYVVQFQAMTWGLVELARRSGEILKLEAHAVFDGDEFDWNRGLNPDLVHKPKVEPDANTMQHVYAVAWLKNGMTQFEVMTKAQVEGIRARSKARSGPWITDYTEMARKTVLKRLLKYLPQSTELRAAIAHDDAVEFGEIEVDAEDVAPRTKTEKVIAKLGLGNAGEAEGETVRGNGPEAEPAEVVEAEEEAEPDPEPEPAKPSVMDRPFIPRKKVIEEARAAEQVKPISEASEMARMAYLQARVQSLSKGMVTFDDFISFTEALGTVMDAAWHDRMTDDKELLKAISQAVDLKLRND